MLDTAGSPGRSIGFVLPWVALVLGAASTIVLSRAYGWATTYAAVSSLTSVVFLAAGLGLLFAGVATWLQRPVGSAGPLAALLGTVWLAPVWVGWQTGPAWVRSTAMPVVPFAPALLLHLVLALPTGRLASPVLRALVGAGYAVTAVCGALRAVTQHPYYDPYCWSNCTDNVFAVRVLPELGRPLSESASWVSAVLAVAAFVTAGARIRRWAVAAPLALAAAAEAAYSLALLLQPAEQPEDPGYLTLFCVRGTAYGLLTAGLGAEVLRRRRQQAAVGRLAEQLGDAPPLGSLQSVLTAALGDPGLRVVYWLPGRGQYVDMSGRAIEPRSDQEHAVTEIRRRGERVAAVVHRRKPHSDHDIARQIGSAARLAIDNERLRAEMLAQVDELRLSRVRIVEAADAERRRIERDLHDGAQQRLLALLFELRMAASTAEARGAPRRARVFRDLAEETRTALDELRELAHGIFPAVLDEAGLTPALWTLADASPVPLDMVAAPDVRLPRAVERVAYLVVSTVVETAARTDPAPSLTIALECGGQVLTVAVDGAVQGPYVHLTDRVGALGGALTSQAGRLRARIPYDLSEENPCV
ncbi:sensor histidine kinase [Streptomyces sp. NPDC006602]|uniref:sensor histidine kinase n=1 Tax=Streptomyces sp. NPDC006602 TaxID=3364751 RepID=UPI00369F3AC4